MQKPYLKNLILRDLRKLASPYVIFQNTISVESGILSGLIFTIERPSDTTSEYVTINSPSLKIEFKSPTTSFVHLCSNLCKVGIISNQQLYFIIDQITLKTD